jgi:hypothetical protein
VDIKIGLIEVLEIGAIAVVIALLIAILFELRKLRLTLEISLSSDRENSRSLMSAIIEAGARYPNFEKRKSITKKE